MERQSTIVSILVPVYNCEDYLEKCLNSVINQTYDNLQIVAIDDGSKDNSWDILNRISEKDSRIEIRKQTNQGVATTRNRLISMAKGDYVLFVDSDDWLELDAVETAIRVQREFDYDLVTFEAVGNDNGINEIYSKDQAIKEFLRHITFRGNLWNKLIRRSLLNGLWFDENISYGEDALMCWGILQKCSKVRVTSNQLYHYRVNDLSISHSSFDSRKFSAYYVWEKICNDVKVQYLDFLDIAQARYAIEMTLLLRDASHCSFKDKQKIRMLQNVVRKFCPLIIKTNISSWKMFIYSVIISSSLFIFSSLQFFNNVERKRNMA